MIGLLIISHCDLGKELLNAAKLIMGRLEAVEYISITQTTESSEMLKSISEKIKKLDSGQGVLVWRWCSQRRTRAPPGRRRRKTLPCCV